MSLMYSTATDTLMTRDQIAQVPTPAALGRFHQPYSFASYIDDVSHGMEQAGLQIVEEEFAIQKDGQRMFGLMEVAPLTGDLITADEWKIAVGLRGSHDQSVSRGIALGTQVMVCSNLCFHGNIGNLASKQTTNLGARLPGLIRNAVIQIPQMAARQERVFDAFRNTEFKPRWGDAALVEIYRRGGFSSPQLTRAIDQWHEPAHAEHAEQGYSAWRLLNASTEALKPTGQSAHMELVESRSQIASSFLEEAVGIDF